MNTEAEAVLQFAKDHHKPTALEVDGAPLVFAPAGLQRVDVEEALAEHRGRPRRAKGTVKAKSVDAFVALVKHLAGVVQAGVVYCAEPEVVAVLDDHSLTVPGFRQHRVVYRPEVSPEWTAWTSGQERPLGQAEFGAFLEERCLDLVDDAQAGERTRGVLQSLGCKVAKAAQLRDLARDFTVRTKSIVREARSLSTGEVQVTYGTEHADAEGRPLTVPSAFLIAIPVFVGGPVYVLVARLRFRVTEGKITWSYKIHGLSDVAREVWTEMRERLEERLPGCLVVEATP